MDCHRCVHLRYDGSRYGRCSLPQHSRVRFTPKSQRGGEPRPYSREECPDFAIRRRCSNCRYWARGEYFADGVTPARKGSCTLDVPRDASDCPLWSKGPTSWRKGGGTGKAPLKSGRAVPG